MSNFNWCGHIAHVIAANAIAKAQAEGVVQEIAKGMGLSQRDTAALERCCSQLAVKYARETAGLPVSDGVDFVGASADWRAHLEAKGYVFNEEPQPKPAEEPADEPADEAPVAEVQPASKGRGKKA